MLKRSFVKVSVSCVRRSRELCDSDSECSAPMLAQSTISCQLLSRFNTVQKKCKATATRSKQHKIFYFVLSRSSATAVCVGCGRIQSLARGRNAKKEVLRLQHHKQGEQRRAATKIQAAATVSQHKLENCEITTTAGWAQGAIYHTSCCVFPDRMEYA